jgi:hypothetical protein
VFKGDAQNLPLRRVCRGEISPLAVPRGYESEIICSKESEIIGSKESEIIVSKESEIIRSKESEIIHSNE